MPFENELITIDSGKPILCNKAFYCSDSYFMDKFKAVSKTLAAINKIPTREQLENAILKGECKIKIKIQTIGEQNKKISLNISVIASLLIVGCASAPKPTKLDDGSALSINNSILEKQYNFVPKDSFLSSQNWTYQIVVEKNSIENDFIKNELVTKTFLLAHNTSKIILVGREDSIKDYKEYSIKNQVVIPIELQPINPYYEERNILNILFFNKVSTKE